MELGYFVEDRGLVVLLFVPCIGSVFKGCGCCYLVGEGGGQIILIKIT